MVRSRWKCDMVGVWNAVFQVGMVFKFQAHDDALAKQLARMWRWPVGSSELLVSLGGFVLQNCHATPAVGPLGLG
jgi:hypothetical protein